MNRPLLSLLVVALLVAQSNASAAVDFDSKARVELGSTYGDNWNFSFDPNQQIEAFASNNGVGIDLRLESERHLFSLVSRGDKQILFTDQDVPDLDSYSASIDWLRRDPLGGLELKFALAERASILTAFEREDVVGFADTETIWQAELSKYREFSPTTYMSMSVSYDRIDFDDQTSVSVRDDTSTYKASVALNKSLSENTTLAANLSAYRIENGFSFVQPLGFLQIPAQQKSSIWLYGPGFSISRVFSERWKFEGVFSVNKQDAEIELDNLFGRSVTESNDWLYFGSLKSVMESRAGVLQFEVSRSFRPSEARLVRLSIQDEVILRWRSQLTEKLNFETWLSGFVIDQQGLVDDNQSGWQGMLRLHWTPARNWGLFFDYRYQNKRIDSLANPAAEVSRQRLTLTLSYQFGEFSS